MYLWILIFLLRCRITLPLYNHISISCYYVIIWLYRINIPLSYVIVILYHSFTICLHYYFILSYYYRIIVWSDILLSCFIFSYIILFCIKWHSLSSIMIQYIIHGWPLLIALNNMINNYQPKLSVVCFVDMIFAFSDDW